MDIFPVQKTLKSQGDKSSELTDAAALFLQPDVQPFSGHRSQCLSEAHYAHPSLPLDLGGREGRGHVMAGKGESASLENGQGTGPGSRAAWPRAVGVASPLPS